MRKALFEWRAYIHWARSCDSLDLPLVLVAIDLARDGGGNSIGSLCQEPIATGVGFTSIAF